MSHSETVCNFLHGSRMEGLLLSVRGPDFSQCDRALRLPRGLINAILSSRRCRAAVDAAIDSVFQIFLQRMFEPCDGHLWLTNVVLVVESVVAMVEVDVFFISLP